MASILAQGSKFAAKARQQRILEQTIDSIREQADHLQIEEDAHLAQQAAALSQQARLGVLVDDAHILVPGIALICEALRRVTGLRLHDVQLLGGCVVARGQIAEMQTGEGKTLVAAIAAFLHGLTRRGVHVATTNSYLAERDFELVSRAFCLLGLSAGVLKDGDGPNAIRTAYQCDITYGTGYQFGFDYLRDQAALWCRAKSRLGDAVRRAIQGQHPPADSLRQRGFAMAIVDEADSVMIDEAMVPLLLSGQSDLKESEQLYQLAHTLASELVEGDDFTIDQAGRRVELKADARVKIHQDLQFARSRDLVRPWTQYIENALHATRLLHRDQHYAVIDDKVQIVDQNTGRILADRTWRDGLHQAVEVKEGVSMRPSTISTARVTRQRFLQRYGRLAGLTGTAMDSAGEFQHFYRLPVVPIPTNLPIRRKQLRTRFFGWSEAKLQAICQSVQQHHHAGQPVLVGTTTIAQSLKISGLLQATSVPHVVLNGVQDQTEASIVARAGRSGAVTVATNMAGRGTDIAPDRAALRSGGLHVIGTENAHSRRIERQLCGRAARQGDPGSSQYFVSADDELFAKCDPALASRIRTAAGPDGECRRDFSNEVKRLQTRLEYQQFEWRRRLVQSDAWFDTVRESLH